VEKSQSTPSLLAKKNLREINTSVDVILERNGVLGCQKLSAQRKYEMLIIAESYSC
jgi:hypothetical protein